MSRSTRKAANRLSCVAQPTCWPAPGPPAILFEFNPITLAQCGEDVDTLAANLTGHILYYVDDLRAQMLPFGEMVENLRKISWICNLFAVPRADAAVRWWATVSGQVRQRLAMRPKNSFN